MLKKPALKSRSISLVCENLTSKTSFSQPDGSNVSLQEISSDPYPMITLLITTPSALCAQGHQLKLELRLKEKATSVPFLATGQAVEVERIDNILRVVFRPVQFDSAQWRAFLEVLNSAAKDVQNIFQSMKD